MADSMKECALAYATRKSDPWAVFPLAERSKVPAIAGGFTNATTDTDTIEGAWNYRPNMNIGIATGGMSGGSRGALVVIDLDVDDVKGEDGLETLHEWERENGELPETVTAITGRGGMHLFYYVTEPLSCSTDPDAGVDIRADGGYIVAPPSVHPDTGRRYEWENHPDDYEVATADDNVLAFIRAHQVQKQHEKFKMPSVIKKGQRDDVLFKFACSLQSQGYDDDAVMACVQTYNDMKCEVPLPQADIERIVNSATKRYEKGEPKAFTKNRNIVERNDKGAAKQTISNYMRVLTNDAALSGRFSYDMRAYTRMVTLPLPWETNGAGERPLKDSDYSGFAMYCEDYGLNSKQKSIDALMLTCEANARNTVQEWLDGLTWDGEERLNFLLPTFLGCEPSDYVVSVTRTFFAGALSRALTPGEKFDCVPVLIGKQGLGKSVFCRRLVCEHRTWFGDNFNTFNGDDAVEKMRGIWIAEISELTALKNSRDNQSIKGFLTAGDDTIRPKYGRETEKRKRACVFIGTTNDASFLTDPTGNRRFLPIECGAHEPAMSLWEPDINAYFEQVWAEAMVLYKQGEISCVLPKQYEATAIAMQEAYTEDNPNIGLIQAYLDETLANAKANALRSGGTLDLREVRVCVRELTEKALRLSEYQLQSKALQNEVHEIMQNKIEGWQKYPESKGKARCGEYGVQRCYIPRGDGE